MLLKYFVLLTSIILFVESTTNVEMDSATTLKDPLDSLKQNMEALRNCIDQSLAQAVKDVNVERHIQPVFNAIGDQLNRFSKAFDAITASSSPDPLAS